MSTFRRCCGSQSVPKDAVLTPRPDALRAWESLDAELDALNDALLSSLRQLQDVGARVLGGIVNGFDFTQHTITNHRFARDGEHIVCRAYLTADHVILADPAFTEATAEEVATVVGEYTNTCELTNDGWKIVRSRLDMAWSKGNSKLFVEAVTRAAQG